MFEVVLQIKDLSIGFHKNNTPLFENLSLSCRSGEITGLVGKNGIGKSTLLKTLAGLTPSLNGHIFLKNKEIKNYFKGDLAKNLSFVPTEIPHVSNLTVFELVAFGRFPYTGWLGRISNEDADIVNDSINQVGVNHIASKQIDEISDGERQRAMIARALAQDTPVIILDEPTAFLDLPNRYGIMRLLNELAAKKGKTILFSTHDLDIAMQEVDKIWLMHEKTIITGSPEDLILNKGFYRLFENSQLQFDNTKGEIRLKRKATKKICLSGTGIHFFWTQRALERVGYEIDNSSVEKNIDIYEKDEKKIWKLTHQNSVIEFASIYDLVMYLK